MRAPAAVIAASAADAAPGPSAAASEPSSSRIDLTNQQLFAPLSLGYASAAAAPGVPSGIRSSISSIISSGGGGLGGAMGDLRAPPPRLPVQLPLSGAAQQLPVAMTQQLLHRLCLKLHGTTLDNAPAALLDQVSERAGWEAD